MNAITTAATVLVVDGNRSHCEAIEVILCAVGYRVLTAESATDALRLARRVPRIDLLLSDVEMPAKRGDKCATRVSRLHPGIQILFVRGSDGPIDTTKQWRFLSKPFTIDELRASVRHALSRDVDGPAEKPLR